MSACECDDPEPATVHLDPPRRDHELRYQVCTECGNLDEHCFEIVHETHCSLADTAESVVG